ERAPAPFAGTAPELGELTFPRAESGVRRAVRPPPEEDPEAPLLSALADSRSGTLLSPPSGSPRARALEGFTTVLPELFEGPRVAQTLTSGRIDGGAVAALEDIVLVGRDRVYVAQRVPHEPALVLATVAGRDASLGYVVSEARASLTRL